MTPRGHQEDRDKRTAGHLVAQLTFGFWVRLGNAPYDHGNSLGPGLWPYAASRFRLCPTTHQTAATTISTLLQQELLGELLANPLRPKIGEPIASILHADHLAHLG